MYIGKNGLLQVHRQHLDWHSQDSLKDVAESLQSQLGSSRSHADYICLKQALKALAQPGEPFMYAADLPALTATALTAADPRALIATALTAADLTALTANASVLQIAASALQPIVPINVLLRGWL